VFVQASIQTTLDESKDTAPIANLQHRFATIHDRELLTCGGLSLNEVQRHFEAGERAAVTTTPGWILLGHPPILGQLRLDPVQRVSQRILGRP
jgi:hypothetical protein